MVSAPAIAAIDWLFETSLAEHCRDGELAPCQITIRHAVPPPAEARDRHVVALNISSYQFRIAVLFDFATDRQSVAYLSRLSRCGEQALEGQALLDAYAEFVNMICGAVNRGLHGAFLHTGMSTPNVLDYSCLRYLAILRPAHVSLIEVVVSETVRFSLTLCICLAPETTLDFALERTAVAEVSSGELEFF